MINLFHRTSRAKSEISTFPYALFSFFPTLRKKKNFFRAKGPFPTELALTQKKKKNDEEKFHSFF